MSFPFGTIICVPFVKPKSPLLSGMEPSKLTDCLLNLSYQRTLLGFEQALKAVMEIFDVNAWACLFPPSFNAGGNNMIIAKGIRENSQLPNQQSLFQLTQFGFNRQTEALLNSLGRELSPTKTATVQIITLRRTRKSFSFLFLFRDGNPFTHEEVDLAHKVGKHLDRCFVLLSQEQEQEFVVGFFRLVSNLYSEGLCLLDTNKQINFDNTHFKEHLYIWENGREAVKNKNLPRQVKLPADWEKACNEAIKIYQQSSFPQVSSRMAITQGPLVRLEMPITNTEYLEGAVRYLAFKSSLGVRPYLLLTTNLHKRLVRKSASFNEFAKKIELSKREREVGDLIMDGNSASRIADSLGVSLTTIKTHIRHILRKAGVRNRLELISHCSK